MYLAELDEGLADEDEGDEEGEDLLGEAGDEADQEASLEGHRADHDDDEPEADPDAARQVLHFVRFAELRGRKEETLSADAVTIQTEMMQKTIVLGLCWISGYLTVMT